MFWENNITQSLEKEPLGHLNCWLCVETALRPLTTVNYVVVLLPGTILQTLPTHTVPSMFLWQYYKYSITATSPAPHGRDCDAISLWLSHRKFVTYSLQKLQSYLQNFTKHIKISYHLHYSYDEDYCVLCQHGGCNGVFGTVELTHTCFVLACLMKLVTRYWL